MTPTTEVLRAMIDLLCAALTEAKVEIDQQAESFREGVSYRGRILDPLDEEESERLAGIQQRIDAAIDQARTAQDGGQGVGGE